MKKRILVINEKIDVAKLFERIDYDYAKSRDIEFNYLTFGVNPHNFSVLKKMVFKVSKWYRQLFFKKMNEDLLKILDNYDHVHFSGIPYFKEYLLSDEVYAKLKTKYCTLSLPDTFINTYENFPRFDIFNKMYTLEHQDISYAQEKYGLNFNLSEPSCQYIHYKKNISRELKYDVCFIGIGNKTRLPYLDAVAEYCKINNLKFWCSGHFWHDANKISEMLSKRKFRKKHPILFQYIKNIFIQPEQVAQIFADSRIVLNINVSYHKTLNTRILNAMSCGALVISDPQNTEGRKLTKGEHFVEVCSSEEMVKKIDYYLQHTDEAKKIALAGKNVVEDNYDYYKVLDMVFEL